MNPELLLDGKVSLYSGDSREVLKHIADCSVDSIVTDPPYALVSISKRFSKEGAAPANSNGASGVYKRASAGFMNVKWDTGETAFAVEFWAEVLRVLKPGGHVVAFSGTRTYHRMVCAIEDAGFEIRDQLAWNFGSGFPKSHNIGKQLDASKERCSCEPHMRNVRIDVDSSEQISGGEKQNLRPYMQGKNDRYQPCGSSESYPVDSVSDLRKVDPPAAVSHQETCGELLQPVMSEQDIHVKAADTCRKWERNVKTWKRTKGQAKSRMEGRGNIQQETRELCERSIHTLPAGSNLDVEAKRVRYGAPSCDGSPNGLAVIESGMCPPLGSCAIEQPADELGVVAGQPESQTRGAWENCRWCGKPVVPDMGTALKPAYEPICLARKPLSEPTIAANVLKHGTGAININGCRIGTDVIQTSINTAIQGGNYARADARCVQQEKTTHSGRWPANVLHDGSAEVVDAFPNTASGGQPTAGNRNGEVYGSFGERSLTNHGASEGSAARFFYTAKADVDERLGSKHPTVKPTDLMQWLVRLVTPIGGTVLDPFAGTGTTGEAAWREGMRAILIEREPEYQADIRRRMSLVLGGPEERHRVAMKPREKSVDDLPLFGGEGVKHGGGVNTADINQNSSSVRRSNRTIGPIGLKR